MLLQCVAVCCSVLPRVAACCSVLQCAYTTWLSKYVYLRHDVVSRELQRAAAGYAAGCCRVLQGVAGCCRVLQGVAVCI